MDEKNLDFKFYFVFKREEVVKCLIQFELSETLNTF